MKLASSIGSSLASLLVASSLAALGCGGKAATTTTTPPDNVEPTPQEGTPAIATALTVAEFNGLVERGDLRPLSLRPTETPIAIGAPASPGRVMGEGSVVSVDQCSGTIELLVDAAGFVYAVVDVMLDQGLITNALGNVPAMQCVTLRYDLEPDQRFAHKIEITDYREFIAAGQDDGY